MSDSSSFRDIAQEAVEPVEEVKEVTQPAVEAPKEEQSQESFTEPVDEKSLETMTPQQLLEMRKNWERAYTAKRQKETAELKEYQRKIAELESRQQTPVSVQEKAEEAREQVELGNMSVEEYTKYLQDLNAEQARKIAREEYQAIHKEEVETQLAERAVSDFKSVDPRLDESGPEHNQSFEVDVKRELAELLDKHMAEHGTYQGFDTKSLTKAIVERKDAELDNIIKTRTKQSTAAAIAREAKLRKNEVRGTASDGQRIGGNSIRDILSDTISGS